MGTLKSIRNGILANSPTQTALRSASRAGVIPPRIYNKLPPLGSHPVTSPAGNSFTYVSHLTDMLARGVVWGNLKVWEVTSLRVFSELVRTAERVLDVGAYTGVYSLVACFDGPAEVIAFEPNPNILPLLAANVRANGLGNRVTVIPKAVSDASGMAHMTIPTDTTAARVDESGSGPRIETTTIDEVLGGRGADVIKIDVEGHEPNAIEGAHDTLAHYRPALIVECLSDRAFTEIREALQPFGYDMCQHLDPGGPLATSGFREVGGHANFLWTSTEAGHPAR